uniref:Uncharacterized protein n=1 Tax=Tanacetum cinerariifolium TaxID=118510 RepID=A0A6L2J630_TANCI|nr:hypothetical protein [Tanacetum cinerariifolium]
MKLLNIVVEKEMLFSENHTNLTPMPKENDFGCKNFLWKAERVRLLISSLGSSSTLSGSSSPNSYSSGTTTPKNHHSGTSISEGCSNYKHLLGKIKVLETTVEMYMHSEQHTRVVQLSSSTHVKPSTLTLNPVRIIPGPAGLVQQAMLLKEKVFILDPDGALMSTQQYMDKVVEDVGDEDDFKSAAWVSATNYVNAFGGTVTGCLGDVDNFLKKGKLEQIVGIVKSCSPNMLGGLNVTLKDLSGTRTETGFKHAFATFFGQYLETFTGIVFLNMDQLDKQLDKEEFQEIGSMAAFKVLETQFQMFIKSRIYLDDEYVVMTRNYFLQYTQLTILEFRDTLIQHMESVKKSIDERAHHKREYDSRVNERHIQTIEEKVDTSKALDASLVDKESRGTKSKEQDTSSRSRNDAHVDDADIRPMYDEEPMAEVHTTAKINVFATGQQHTEQPEFNNEGKVVQNVTTNYFPKERETASAKPHYVIASSNSRNSSKNMQRFSSNNMVHNHYLEEAKKKTQETGRNSRPSVMPSARSQSTTIGSKPKPQTNNQKYRNWAASKSSCVTTKTVLIAEHSRNSRNFSNSKHFVCSTCQKCVFNANHNHCVTKFLNEVNSRAKVPSNKTMNNNKPVE